MGDPITQVGRSTLQHGPENDRIYVMKLAEGDAAPVLSAIRDILDAHHYSKVFMKVRASLADAFLRDGFEQEAEIPRFFGGEETCLFLSKFLTDDRRLNKDRWETAQVLSAAQAKKGVGEPVSLPDGYVCREAGTQDSEEMAALYREVFASYPFPIHDPGYIVETMETHVAYWGVWQGDVLAALASSEIDREDAYAEMTDFATHPEYRGQGLALYLLQEMERAMADRGIRTVFTIARAVSYGMNITFSKQGYTYGGTLVQNTHISGSIENMNVWYKHLT